MLLLLKGVSVKCYAYYTCFAENINALTEWIIIQGNDYVTKITSAMTVMYLHERIIFSNYNKQTKLTNSFTFYCHSGPVYLDSQSHVNSTTPSSGWETHCP